MKILIVDDNPRRYSRLVETLGTAGISRENVAIVTSAMDARDKLQYTQFDLMIIDIVLPLRPEEAPSERHSQELLAELTELDDMIRPRHVIGLSAFPDAAQQVTPFFRERVWTVISYSDSSDDWLTQIVNCVRYLASVSTAVGSPAHGVDLLLVSALADPELKAVLNLPWSWSAARPVDDVTFVHDGQFQSGGRTFSAAATSSPRMGMVSSAVTVAKLIEVLHPRFVVMVGICAGIRGKANIGDVIFADPCWDWQSGKWTRQEGNRSFAISPHQLAAAPHIRARMELVRAERTALGAIAGAYSSQAPGVPRLIIGPMASGSAVLADQELASELRQQHRDLCAIEMEAYGVYEAANLASTPRPSAFALKAVCDFADETKSDDFQGYASYVSAAVMRLFFEANMSTLPGGS